MHYQALLGAKAKGGKVSASDQGLTIEGADEVTLIVSAGTDWRDKEFARVARTRLDGLQERVYGGPFQRAPERFLVDEFREREAGFPGRRDRCSV